MMRFVDSILNKLAGFKLFAGLAVTVSVLALNASAQTKTTDGATPLGIAPGTPDGSYGLSGFDNVNLYNGNLNFNMPLLQIGGRGGAKTSINLAIDSTKWTTETSVTEGEQEIYNLYEPGDHGQIVGAVGDMSFTTPIDTWWGGLRVGYGPGVLQGRRGGDGKYGPNQLVHRVTLTRLTFTGPDGTEYELRDVSTGGTPHKTDAATPTDGFNRGRFFVSAVGTAMTFIVDASLPPIRDAYYQGTSEDSYIYPTGYLLLADGTRYRVENGLVTSIRDRNGNRMTFEYESDFKRVIKITDSLNRVVEIVYADFVNRSCDEIKFKGFGGAHRSILVHQSRMKFVLRSEWGTSAWSYHDLFPDLDGSSSATNYNPRVVSAVELPDGRRYSFYYNPWGEIARIVLPTGGAIEYDYANGSAETTGNKIHRRVTERRVYPAGGTGTTYEGKQIYTANYTSLNSAAPYYTDVAVEHRGPYPGNQLLSREKHYFYGSPVASLFALPTFYEPWKDGREYKTESFDAAGTMVVSRADNTWQQKAAISWWTGASDAAPPNDVRMTVSQSTLADATPNRVKKQEYSYDGYNNKTEVREYGYGDGAPGGLVRKTVTAYKTDASYTAGDLTSAHLRRLPTQESVYDAGGIERARTTYEYDNYATPLTARTGISGHDAAFGTSYAARGNVTAVTRLLLPGTQITARNEYDIAGNIVRTIDARNNASTFDFSDRFGFADTEARSNTPPVGLGGMTSYALATAATNAAGHTTYTQFDYDSGKVVNVEDINRVVTAAYYEDVLDRPTRVVAVMASPAGTSLKKQILYAYNDLARTVTTESDLNTFEDGLLKSESVYDGLGRTVESRTYEPGGGYISSKQRFDALGRTNRAYNSHRTTNDETYGWADTTYDAVGRVIKVETFDRFGASTGAVVTAYSNDRVTVRDQAGKQRRSTTDALGRLIQVDEMQAYPSISVYAVTSYGYDALDNLTGVSQGGQTRSFIYDSLSRLKQATNPESGTIGYVYDSSSNLTQKTDARAVVTTYVYDNLNRVTSRSYSDGTPAVTYSYDTASVAFSKGKLTQVSSSVSSSGFDEYDALGRVKRSSQMTGGVVYLMDYGYDLAGNLKSQTYPSGRTITTSYDAAGRVSQVSGQKTGEAAKTYASQFAYAANGAVKQMQLGNGLWETAKFNSRSQAVEIALGTSSTDASKLKLNYSYGTSTNNGNVTNQTITVGSTQITQSYSYDAVNRLTSAQESLSGSTRWTQSYGYDQWGNRTSLTNTGTEAVLLPTQSTPAVNSLNNRLTGYGYDLAGNVTSDGAGNTYSYDAENRQTRHLRTGVSDTSYGYDGDGRRVKKVDSANTTLFVYDAEGKLVADYTTAAPQQNGTSYLTQDALGSTRVVTTQSGAVRARHDLMPFGEEVASNVGGRSAVAGYAAFDGVRQKFTGKERDSESGLDYFMARYYSSAQGRFTSVDPENAGASADDTQSWNGYAYSRNNPLKYVDPDGKTYRLYDLNGNYQDISDKDADDWRRQDGVDFKKGKIFDKDGNQLGTYKRTWFDDGSVQFNQFVFGMAARAPAMKQAIAGFAVSTAVVGATGGAAAYFSGVVLGESSITTLGLRGAAEAARAAEVGGVLAQAASIVGNQAMRVSSRAAAEQAAKEWVGQGARAIVNRQTGQFVGKISADGTKIARYTSADKAIPYINLVNNVTGGNLHVYF